MGSVREYSVYDEVWDEIGITNLSRKWNGIFYIDWENRIEHEVGT